MRAPDPNCRIAVTGAGIICSIGRNKDEVWRSIVESRSGIAPLTRFGEEGFPAGVAAEVSDPLAVKARRRLSRTDRLAMIAAREALEQASVASPLPLESTIVATGTSTGGLLEGEEFFFRRLIAGRRRAPVSRVVQQPTSGPSDAVAAAFGLGGGVISNATACASGGAAIGMAADLLRSQRCDAALAGGSDALCRLTYSGFNVLQAVDSEPCRPFSSERSGITLGEGAGFLVLERWDDARARNASILGEVCSWGASCDAYHPTAPAEDGRGAEAAMRRALAESKLDAVDYVNAHGTGTLLNDSSESRAIVAACGAGVPVSSSKSFFGHTLGAAGGVEAVITVLALLNQLAPPTLRLRDPAPDCALDHVPETPRPITMNAAISNTFGFGGSNVAVLFRRA
jgi:3-oxoacyl-[acyl-carrier-protein] synthase II